MKPTSTEYNAYFSTYINKVETENLLTELKSSAVDFENLITTIAESKGNFKYAENKWTVKQLLLHVLDTERIFAYRALCFIRNEKQSLPAFEENGYAENCNAQSRTIASILNEFKTIRQATLSLFEAMNETDLVKLGIANNNTISVRAIGFIIVGHQLHHQQVLQQKYLAN